MSRSTGFSPLVKQIVDARSHGYCERCTERLGSEYHHRRPRAMGSTRRPETNLAGNCLFVCVPCHRRIEGYRHEALAKGWLVRQSHDPRVVPVFWRDRWVLLDDDGGVLRTTKGAA